MAELDTQPKTENPKAEPDSLSESSKLLEGNESLKASERMSTVEEDPHALEVAASEIAAGAEHVVDDTKQQVTALARVHGLETHPEAQQRVETLLGEMGTKVDAEQKNLVTALEKYTQPEEKVADQYVTTKNLSPKPASVEIPKEETIQDVVVEETPQTRPQPNVRARAEAFRTKAKQLTEPLAAPSQEEARVEITENTIDNPDTSATLDALAQAVEDSTLDKERIKNGGKTNAELVADLEALTNAPAMQPEAPNDRSATTESIAQAVQERAAEKNAKKEQAPIDPEDPKSHGIYDRLRKISWLKGYADRKEAEHTTKKIDKLSLKLVDVDAEIKYKVNELIKSGKTEEEANALPEIMALHKRGKEIRQSISGFEQLRDAAADRTKERIDRKIDRPKARLEQVEAGIEEFKRKIDEYNQSISELQTEKEAMKDVVSNYGLRDFDRRMRQVQRNINDIKRKMSNLVVEKNSLSLHVKDLQTASEAFEEMQQKDESGKEKTTFDFDTPAPVKSSVEDTNKPEVKAELAVEEEKEVKTENKENFENQKPLQTLVDTWNTISGRYNRVNKRNGDPLLPQLDGTSSQLDEVLTQVKKTYPDIDAEHVSPEAFKLFIQTYSENNTDKKSKLKATDRLRRDKDSMNALAETMEELGVKADDALYEVKKPQRKTRKKAGPKIQEVNAVDAINQVDDTMI